MIDKIEILQHGESRDFGCHPCEESTGLLRIVAYRHELVTQLGKDRFNSLSEAPVCPRRRSPVLLVQPIRHFKGNVRRPKEVQLHRHTEISHFQVGKGGNNAPARHISLLVYLISCKFLAYLKNLSELCNEVVHTYDNST